MKRYIKQITSILLVSTLTLAPNNFDNNKMFRLTEVEAAEKDKSGEEIPINMPVAVGISQDITTTANTHNRVELYGLKSVVDYFIKNDVPTKYTQLPNIAKNYSGSSWTGGMTTLANNTFDALKQANLLKGLEPFSKTTSYSSPLLTMTMTYLTEVPFVMHLNGDGKRAITHNGVEYVLNSDGSDFEDKDGVLLSTVVNTSIGTNLHTTDLTFSKYSSATNVAINVSTCDVKTPIYLSYTVVDTIGARIGDRLNTNNGTNFSQSNDVGSDGNIYIMQSMFPYDLNDTKIVNINGSSFYGYFTSNKYETVVPPVSDFSTATIYSRWVKDAYANSLGIYIIGASSLSATEINNLNGLNVNDPFVVSKGTNLTLSVLPNDGENSIITVYNKGTNVDPSADPTSSKDINDLATAARYLKITKNGSKLTEGVDYTLGTNNNHKTVVFTNIKSGIYEMSTYYDYLENGELKSRLVGSRSFTVGNFECNFDANGGQFHDGTTLVKGFATDGDTIVFPKIPPYRKNYKFNGWYTDAACTIKAGTISTQDQTYYAGWANAKTYTVSYVVGNGVTPINPEIVVEGQRATEPQTPTREGYSFSGWYTSTNYDFSNYFDFMPSVTSDLTLYARWVVNSNVSAVKFYDGESEIPYLEKSVATNSRVTKPIDPEKDGYTFIGWYEDQAFTTLYNFNKPVSQNLLKLYGKWEMNSYNVNFYDENGTLLSTVGVPANYVMQEPTAPTKEGHTFTGWKLESTSGSLYDFNNTINSNINLYAGFDTNLYTVSFDSNGGTTPNNIVVPYGNKLSDLPTPIKTNYVFLGWYTNTSLTNKFSLDAIITGNMTLYGAWEIDPSVNSVTVTCNTNDGSYIAPITIPKGTTAKRPSDPYKVGNKFEGWYKDADLNEPFSFEGPPIETDITIYAKWSSVEENGQKYATVTFNSNGGSFVQSQKVIVGERGLRPNDPYKTGYTFVSWYKDYETTIPFSSLTPITEDITLYAKWADATIPKEYVTLNFETNGGTIYSQNETTGEIEIITKDTTTLKETNPNRPNDPEKEGYNFVGWYSDSDFKTPFIFSNKLTKDTTIHAKWEEVKTPVVLTYTSDDGRAPYIRPETYNKGEIPQRPNDPIRPAYKFLGWYNLSDDSEYNFDTPITGDMTIYSKWKIDSDIPSDMLVIVDFDTENKPYMQDGLTVKGNSINRPTDPYRKGYIFDGWYLEGETTPFDFSTILNSDIKLVAKFIDESINTVTLSFNTDGGSYIAPISVESGKSTYRPNDPVKAGYTFINWYEDNSFNTLYNFDAPLTVDKEIYAKFVDNTTPIEYITLTFNTNEGSFIPNQQVVKDSASKRPTDPYKTGYKFLGWYSNSSLTNEFNFNAPLSAPTTIYAKWEEIKNPEKDYVKLSYNTDNGSYIAEQSVEKNTVPNKPSDPYRTGYKFEGWFTDDTFTNEFDFTTVLTGDSTAFAKWEKVDDNVISNKEYIKLSYNTNGGSYIAIQNVEKDTAPNKPSDPYKTGYEFKGWFTDDTLTNEFDFTIALSGDSTAFAKWEKVDGNVISDKEYVKLSYNTNGGSYIAIQNVEKDTAPNKPSDPYRTGYEFKGWFTDDTLTNEFDFTIALSGDSTAFAKWEKVDGNVISDKEYIKLSYNTNGGSYIAIQNVEKDTAPNKPSDPYKTGYEFEGWYKDDSFTDEFEFTTALSTDTIAYAKWKKVEDNVISDKEYVKLSYDTNGGSYVAIQNVEKDTSPSKTSDPYRTGFEFKGWFVDNETFSIPFDFDDVLSVDTTIYAKWEKIGVEPGYVVLAFDTDGGSYVEYKEVKIENVAKRPSDPYKRGYVFTGWVDEKGNAFSFTEPLTSNKEIKATWEIDDFYNDLTKTPIHTDLVVGMFNANKGSDVFPQIISKGDSLEIPETPIREGYTFNGWYTTSALINKFDFNTKIDKNTVVYAGWTKTGSSDNDSSNDGSSGGNSSGSNSSGSSSNGYTKPPLSNNTTVRSVIDVLADKETPVNQYENLSYVEPVFQDNKSVVKVNVAYLDELSDSLFIKSNDTIYKLPKDLEASSEEFRQMLASKNLSSNDVFIVITLTTDADNKKINDTLKAQFDNYTTLTMPTTFEASIVDATTSKELLKLNSFDTLVEKDLALVKDLTNDYAVVRLDENRGKFVFTPHTKNTINDTNLLKVMSSMNGDYVGISRKVNFNDVTNEWFSNNVNLAAQKLLVEGVGNNNFNPTGKVTKAEFVQMIVNITNPTQSTTTSFSDVSKNKWYYNSIASAQNANLLKGFTGNNFDPESPITREEMALILSNAIDYANVSKYAPTVSLNKFTDKDSINENYLDAVQNVVNYGIIVGQTDTTLNPKATATRAEATTALVNTLRLFEFID